jgi:hypothetical protein
MSDTPKTSEAAGEPSHNWDATAERLFECSCALERENNRLRDSLESLEYLARNRNETRVTLRNSIQNVLRSLNTELTGPKGPV